MGWLKRRIIEHMEPTEYELARRWIPVDERLPDEGQDVLAYSAEIGTQVAHIDGKSWYWGTSGVLGFDATHWMPLPAPPQDGKQPANQCLCRT